MLSIFLLMIDGQLGSSRISKVIPLVDGFSLLVTDE